MSFVKPRTQLLFKQNERERSLSNKASKSVCIDVLVESSPLVFYGNNAESSGTFFSGQLKLDVSEPIVVFDSIEVQLHSAAIVEKPVVNDCPECRSSKLELKKWSFAPASRALHKGEHKFPVSYLFAGHLPATSHNPFVIIKYYVSAIAKTSTGKLISCSKT
jgi:arrestin-related trafficking adapter 1